VRRPHGLRRDKKHVDKYPFFHHTYHINGRNGLLYSQGRNKMNNASEYSLNDMVDATQDLYEIAEENKESE